MATYTERLQHIWKRYEAAGMPTPATTREVAAWAIEHRLWEPHRADIIAQCAEDLAKALREEYRTDRRGRRYRAKHAVRISQGGQQMTFWADIDNAPREHMEKAFAQRRAQIVGDCYQLKTDVDCYNDVHASEPPIQIILDFSQDVEELQSLDNHQDDAAD
jgi:hypothetical protein